MTEDRNVPSLAASLIFGAAAVGKRRSLLLGSRLGVANSLKPRSLEHDPEKVCSGFSEQLMLNQGSPADGDST
jgi:hypothetical protein